MDMPTWDQYMAPALRVLADGASTARARSSTRPRTTSASHPSSAKS